MLFHLPDSKILKTLNMFPKKSTLRHDLRIASLQRGRKITLLVNDKPVPAYEGESVHAALIAAGIRNFRFSKTGKPRGIFCGMGICYECLITIDHQSDQRACITMAKDQMAIQIETVVSVEKMCKEENTGGNE